MAKWKGVGRRWNLKKAQDVGMFELAKMSTQEKAELAQFYYNEFNRRSEQFVRAGVIPYAWRKMFRDYQKRAESDKVSDLQRAISLDSPIVEKTGHYRQLAYPFSEMSNPSPSLSAYIRRMQAFFKSKTSTVKGWKEVSNAQDVALFGGELNGKYRYAKDENGKRHRVYIIVPNDTLSEAERIALWEVIDLAKDEGWLNRFGYDSGQAHKDIASLYFSGEITHGDIEKALKDINDIINQRERRRTEFSDVATGDKTNPIPRTDEGGDINGEYGRPDLLSGQDETVF